MIIFYAWSWSKVVNIRSFRFNKGSEIFQYTNTNLTFQIIVIYLNQNICLLTSNINILVFESHIFFHIYIRTSLATTPTKKIKMIIYFENLTVRLHFLYILNTHIKFRVNQMLFIIQSLNLIFMHNFRLLILERANYNLSTCNLAQI